MCEGDGEIDGNDGAGGVIDENYGDFDDDEYIQELFLSIHGTIFFTMDNQDDRSFLLEDENDFFKWAEDKEDHFIRHQ